MSYSIEQLAKAVELWLVKGDLDPGILSDEFEFNSPFWKKADRQSFLDKFLDPTEYIEKSLSNIVSFDPIQLCFSDAKDVFTITLTYHTQNGTSVDECVLCHVKEGRLVSMRSIYDLVLTKKAHNLSIEKH